MPRGRRTYYTKSPNISATWCSQVSQPPRPSRRCQHTRIRASGIGLHLMAPLAECDECLTWQVQFQHPAFDPPVAPFLLKVVYVVIGCHEPGIVVGFRVELRVA